MEVDEVLKKNYLQQRHNSVKGPLDQSQIQEQNAKFAAALNQELLNPPSFQAELEILLPLVSESFVKDRYDFQAWLGEYVFRFILIIYFVCSHSHAPRGATSKVSYAVNKVTKQPVAIKIIGLKNM